MSEPTKKSIKDSVLSAIEAGKVTMKPKWHFVVKAVLLVLGIVLSALALIYVVSFIFFMLHQTGVWFTPGFGFRGIREFLFGLPWLLILLSILFIAVLQILVKKYSFSYGRPLLYSAIAIIGVVVISGFVVSLTPVHRGLFRQAQQDRLPLAGGFYRQFGNPRPQGNVVPGEITEVTDQGYKIVSPLNESITVIVTPDTRFPLGTGFEKGDKIVVIGDRDGDNITAFGIREITDDIIRPPTDGRQGPSGIFTPPDNFKPPR